jgi:hypothetical protein
MLRNKIIPCPACSALVTMHAEPTIGHWGVCPMCDGMIGRAVTKPEARRRLGAMDAWDNGNAMDNPATCRYFDVSYADGGRTHGWYNPANGKVVQIG